MKRFGIVGGGVAGLSLACLLAERGHQVSVFEKNAWWGGKLRRLEDERGCFDTGPSVMTFIGVWEKYLSLFGLASQKRLTQVKWERQSQPTRYWCAKKFLDLPIKKGDADEQDWNRYLHLHAPAYDSVEYLLTHRPQSWGAIIHAFKLLCHYRAQNMETVMRRFPQLSLELKQAIAIHSLNQGVSRKKAAPFFASLPAFMALRGSYQPQKGMYHLVEVLVETAGVLGVQLYNSESVESVHCLSIQTEKRTESFDAIVLSLDEGRLGLMGQTPVVGKDETLSCSALALYGEMKDSNLFDRHQVILPLSIDRFEKELEGKLLPSSTMAYIVPALRPGQGGILLTLPAKKYDPEELEAWKQVQLRLMAQRLHLEPLQHWKEFHTLTPEYYGSFGHPLGALYGTVPSMPHSGPFHPRPHQVGHQKHLFRVGASVHPGGGLPAILGGVMMAFEKMT